MTPCTDCTKAQAAPLRNWFNPACLHCGARMIQHLGTLPIAPSAITQRRRQVLLDWGEHGHSEQALRALAKGPLAIAPQTEPSGPVALSASVPQAKPKRR